jgi:hypothetical protein
MRYEHRAILLTTAIAMALCVGAFADTLPIETGTSFNLVVNDANYVFFDPCVGVTPGGTSISPLEYLPRQNEYTDDMLAALYSQYGIDTSNDDYTIVYQYSVSDISLTGTMLIDWYQAVDDHAAQYCYHGAEIVAYYDYGSGEDTLGLDWVQVYDETGDSSVSPYEYTVDGAHDQSPAYYAPGYGPWTPPGYTLASGHDMTWTDGPYDRHVETQAWAGGVEFYMFLASFSDIYADPDSTSIYYQDVTIYDGIVWGYSGICVVVPEPATLGMVSLGLAGFLLRRLRREG